MNPSKYRNIQRQPKQISIKQNLMLNYQLANLMTKLVIRQNQNSIRMAQTVHQRISIQQSAPKLYINPQQQELKLQSIARSVTSRQPSPENHSASKDHSEETYGTRPIFKNFMNGFTTCRGSSVKALEKSKQSIKSIRQRVTGKIINDLNRNKRITRSVCDYEQLEELKKDSNAKRLQIQNQNGNSLNCYSFDSSQDQKTQRIQQMYQVQSRQSVKHTKAREQL